MSEVTWMTTKDVMNYIQAPSLKATQQWMWRANVRRCSTNNRLTCKEWVDAALARKGKR